MNIVLKNIGKRFNKEWIFRNLNYEFSIGNKYAILGTNGCGKSTLLQIIAGAVSETEGAINYHIPLPAPPKGERAGAAGVHPPPLVGDGGGLSLAAPYLDLPEEMTWKEAVKFHGKFKKWTPTLKGEGDVISISELGSSANKEIRNFSSGMKQRARLTLAILSDTPLLLLDEPSTNLDANAVKWYQNLISEFAKERLVIVCSNYNKEEYSFCNIEFVLPA
ncbi:MAG: ATP-binding cassette domain-containing protein [Bacteroidetes bacterium]|nr:MAG: ATP-binding cassette domain-containing protein [Bacteroidota bacterium]